MPDVFNRNTEPETCAPLAATAERQVALEKEGIKLPGVNLEVSFPGGGIDDVKLVMTDSTGALINIGLIQKLTLTLDAMEMLPKAVLEFIPASVVISGQVSADFKPVTLFVDTQKDSNGSEFSRQWTLDQPTTPIYVKAESDDGKID